MRRAFRLEGCHFVNFDSALNPTSRVIAPQGTATIHANNSCVSATFAPPGALTFVGFADFSGATQGWSGMEGWSLRDEDGSLSGVSGGCTLISNHPLMTIGGTPIGTYMFASPHKFGLMSLRYDETIMADPSTMPKVWVTRRGVGTSPAVYLNGTDLPHHRQVTMIVDGFGFPHPGFVYELDWSGSALPSAGYITSTMDDLAPGDVARIDMIDGGTLPNVTVEDVTTVLRNDVTASPPVLSDSPPIDSVSGSGYAIGPNRELQLRLEIPSGRRHCTLKITWG